MAWPAGRRDCRRGPRRTTHLGLWYTFCAMNPFYKNLALWMVIGLIVILLFNLFQARDAAGEIVFSDFLKKSDGEAGGHAAGRWAAGSSPTVSRFRTMTADYPDLVKNLKDRGVRSS